MEPAEDKMKLSTSGIPKPSQQPSNSSIRYSERVEEESVIEGKSPLINSDSGDSVSSGSKKHSKESKEKEAQAADLKIQVQRAETASKKGES